jgi:hypothetical protein
MTTIACDGKSMASDGQGDVADTIVVRTRCKISGGKIAVLSP